MVLVVVPSQFCIQELHIFRRSTSLKSQPPCLSGVSAETGYDWAALSDYEKGPVQQRFNGATVGPNESVTVFQALGKCGESTIYTGKLRFE